MKKIQLTNELTLIIKSMNESLRKKFLSRDLNEMRALSMQIF